MFPMLKEVTYVTVETLLKYFIVVEIARLPYDEQLAG